MIEQHRNIAWCALSLGLILGAVIGIVGGEVSEFAYCRQMAVRHHAAHWIVGDDGNTAFVWNDEKEPIR